MQRSYFLGGRAFGGNVSIFRFFSQMKIYNKLNFGRTILNALSTKKFFFLNLDLSNYFCSFSKLLLLVMMNIFTFLVYKLATLQGF